MQRLIRAAAAACLLAAAPLAAAAVHAAPATPAASTAAAVPAAHFSSDRISVRVIGQGSDVVLIPGLACPPEVWDALIARYAGSYRLHLVQISGFAGRPAEAAPGPVFEPAAKEVARYIREAKLQRPALIGHSLGGATALYIAETAPGSVSKVMIVDSLPFYSVLFGAEATPEGARPFADAMVQQLMAATPEDFAKGQAAGMTRLVKDPAGRAKAVDWSVRSNRATVANAIRDLMTTDLRPGLGQVSAPVTVLYAWDAAMGPQAQADALWAGQYAGLKGVRLVRIDSSLHFIMYDQPEAFLQAVETFLGN